MSIDLSKATALSDQYGNIVQLELGGRVIWAVSGGKVILQVEKITSNTYAAETTYENEQFILLDIYPKTNGTVTVTYGGLTKTIMDTSGAEEPNAQQVFFGTFNGVSDSVATPVSGELTIEGQYRGFGSSSYKQAPAGKETTIYATDNIVDVVDLGSVSYLPGGAFGVITYPNETITSIIVPKSMEILYGGEFGYCSNLTNLCISPTVKVIGGNPCTGCLQPNPITVDVANSWYKIDGNCLIEIATNKLLSYFKNSTIPSYVTSINRNAFVSKAITSITSLATEPPAFDFTEDDIVTNPFGFDTTNITTITVPKGSGEKYKAAVGWSNKASIIVEAS